jgi:hypothetical protein
MGFCFDAGDVASPARCQPCNRCRGCLQLTAARTGSLVVRPSSSLREVTYVEPTHPVRSGARESVIGCACRHRSRLDRSALRGGGGHAAAPAHAATNVGVTFSSAHIAGLRLSPGALKGATLTHTMVGGQHANVVEMPLKNALSGARDPKLRQSGFHLDSSERRRYYCRHEHWTRTGGSRTASDLPLLAP